MKSFLHSFWNIPAPELLKELQTTTQGLSEEEVQKRIAYYGSNLLKPRKKTDGILDVNNPYGW
jgi:Mg2+-importing ATPase